MINAAKCIEVALYETIRKHSEPGAAVQFRVWQSMRRGIPEGTFTRSFPCVDIRCSPPVTENEGVSLATTASILCGAMAADDEDHAAAVSLYEAVQGVCDALYAQALSRTDGAEMTTFKAALAEESTVITLGGFRFADGLAPYDDAGVNMVGINFVVAYTRSDM